MPPAFLVCRCFLPLVLGLGLGFLCLATPTEGYAAPLSVHLSVRADGRDGVGTANDPRDASDAAKLDALWPGLPKGAKIYFAAGTFQTTTGLLLKDGQRVIGEGARRTTLMFAAGALAAGSYPIDHPLVCTLLRSQSMNGNNHVRGLRLDGNREHQPAYVQNSPNSFLAAITLYGNDCSIRDVHYLNGFSHSEGEAFPILIETQHGTAAAPGRGFIERVVVEEHNGYNTSVSLLAQTKATHPVSGTAASGVITTASPHSYVAGDEVILVGLRAGTGLVEGRPYFARDITPNSFRVAAAPGGPAVPLASDFPAGTCIQPRRITGAIRDCVVLGRTDGAFSKTIGFGCGGWQRVTLQGNRTEGVGIGVNTDTHCYRDVRIVGNHFGVRADPRGSQAFGIFLGGGYSWTRYFIADNTFTLSRNAAALVLNGNVQDVLFTRNVVRVTPDGAGASESISLRGEGNANLRLVDNQVDPRLRFSGQPGVVTARVRNRALAVPSR